MEQILIIKDARKKLIQIKQDTLTGAIRRHMPFGGEELFESDEYRALDMAIDSLEAWEDIRQEIIKQISKVPTFQNEYLNGLKTAYAHTLAIIDEHLKEVTT